MDKNTILLVEDNPDDETLTLRAFKKHKFTPRMIVARDGNEALDYLFGKNKYADRDTRELPALVLLDLQLPKIGGLDVLRQLRANENTKLLPVVILTSSTENTDINSSYKLGANSYIRKPVNFDEFSDTVGLLAPYWLKLNQQPKRPT